MTTPAFKLAIRCLALSMGLLWLGGANGGESASAATSALTQLLQDADSARTANPQRFAQLLTELTRRRDEADPRQRQHLDYLLAMQQMFLGERVEAERQLLQVISNDSNPELQYRATALLANNYVAMREFVKAFRALNDALALESKIGNRQVLHEGLMNSADILNTAGRHDLAEQYAERVLADQPVQRLLCGALVVKLESRLRRHLGPDDPLASAAIAECDKAGEPIMTTYAIAYIARERARRGDPAGALAQLETYYPQVVATAYPWLIGDYNGSMAELNYRLGRYALAETQAQAALDALAGDRSSPPAINAYRTLYRIARRRGDAEAALAHHEALAEAEKLLIDSDASQQVAFEQVRFEIDTKTRQIELLNKENEVLRLRRMMERQSARTGYLFAAVLAGILGSLGIWAYRTKKIQLRLRALTEVDALTGALSRQRFSEMTELRLKQARDGASAVALILFDLDHFKSINDRFGHAVGDWALKRCVAVCRAALAPHEFIGRLGGEEFAIVLSAADAAEATRRAEHFRQLISAIDTTPSGNRFALTASFGVTDSLLAGASLQALLARADRVMYQAKHSGRNLTGTDIACASLPG